MDSGARGSTDGRPNAASADDACSSSVQQCALESSYYSSSALSSRHAAPPGRLQSRAPPVAGPRVPLPAGSPGQCLHTASAQCPSPPGWLAGCWLPAGCWLRCAAAAALLPPCLHRRLAGCSLLQLPSSSRPCCCRTAAPRAGCLLCGVIRGSDLTPLHPRKPLPPQHPTCPSTRKHAHAASP